MLKLRRNTIWNIPDVHDNPCNIRNYKTITLLIHLLIHLVIITNIFSNIRILFSNITNSRNKWY